MAAESVEGVGATSGPRSGRWRRLSLVVVALTTASVLALPAGPAAAAAAPTVTSLSPTSGSSGTTVVLTGTNLAGATEVEFGTVPSAYEVVSATKIIADASGVDGSTVHVRVTTSGGESAATSANSFTFLAYPAGLMPGVGSLDPADGPAGTAVTISGYGLSGATAVHFGSVSASFTVVDDEQITATAPAGTLGTTVPVTVTVPAGTSPANDGSFSYHTVSTDAQPDLYEVFPDVAPPAGGVPVDLFGTGLSGVTSVHFGTATATFQVLSDSEIAAVAPAGSTGSVDITLTSSGGTSPLTSADAFTYEPPPTVTSVSPSSGVIGASVTITGTGFTSLPTFSFADYYYYFLPGQDYGCLVLFGSTCAASAHIVSPTQIVAVAPSGPPSGAVDVRVATADGESAVSSGDVFTYKAATGVPVVTSVSPGDGSLSAGSYVAITGQGFTGTTAVAFGSTPAKQFSVEDDQALEAVVPAATVAGTVDVKVTNGTGTSSAVAADHFTYVGPPTVTSLSPTTGTQGGGTRVTVDGTGFTDVGYVEVGGVIATSVTVISATQLTLVTPPGASGSEPVTVTTVGGTSAMSSADLFTYATLAPGVLGITPSSGPAAGGTTVTVSGTGFSSTSTVAFGGVAATSVTYVSPNSLIAVAPAGKAGTSVAVTVVSGGKTSATSHADLFTYLVAPTVTGISPATGPSGGGNVVTVTGTGFSGVTSVLFGTAPVDPSDGALDVDSATTLTVQVPAGSIGTVDVTVVTGGGTSATSSSDHYAYTGSTPAVTGLSPAAGPVAGGGTVAIDGVGLLGATEVEFGSVPVHFTVESSTAIEATAPPGAAGTVAVTVTTPGGSSASTPADQYTYLAGPTVSSLSSTSGPPAGGNTILVTGSGFSACTQDGYDTCTVEFGNGESIFAFSGGVSPLAVLSATELSVQVPVGVGGSRVDVRVVSPEGTSPLSSGDVYTYTAAVAPTVTEVYAGSGPAGTTVEVLGTGFTTASQVLFGTVPATSFLPVADGYLEAVVPAGSGTVDVTVKNAVGTSAVTPVDRFTYTSVSTAAPTITKVSPNSGPETGGTLVTITGTNLDDLGSYGAEVSFGGAAATVESETATSITAVSPSAPPGKVNITVTGYYGGSTSAITTADQFTYKGVAPTVDGVGPSTGSTSGGTLVDIEGAGFFGVTGVSFGGSPAVSFLPEEAGTLTEAVSPAHAAATTDVTVSDSVGASERSPSDRFTFSAEAVPTVTAVSPSSGATAGGTVVTITGTGFQSVDRVSFGAFAASSFEVNSATSITALSPAQGTGVVDLTVGGADGTSAPVATDHFTYTGGTPTVTAMSPSAGPTGGDNEVVINGLNLAGTTAVHFGTVASPRFQIVPDPEGGGWEVDAVAPPGAAGTQNVSVTTPAGTSPAVAASSYTYVAAPAVTGVSPTTGPTTGGTIVTVTGTNLADAVAASVGGDDASIDSDTATSLTLSTPGQPAGTYDVQVTTAGGTSPAVTADHFTYAAVAPTVTEVYPSSGPLSGGNGVYVGGTGLYGLTSVDFGSVPATIVDQYGDYAYVLAPAEAAGVVHVVATTSAGSSTVSSADEYTYAAVPTVTAVTPDTGPTAGGTVVTITGTGFVAGSYDVDFGTREVTGTVTSPTSITAEAPGQPAGVVDVVVTGSNGTSATGAADRFTYVAPVPTVTAVSPPKGPTTGGTSVTVTGTGFTGATAVTFGTVAATSFTVSSDTSITAYSPGAAAGVVNLVVTTAGGSSAAVTADHFTYAAPPPEVSGISPAYGAVAGGTLVTVYGSGFTGATKVAFGTVAATTFAVQDDGELTVKSPAQAASIQDVLVTTPVATSAAVTADKFTYGTASGTVPTVTGVSPATGSTDGDTPVTITGTNFTGATAVDFGLLPAADVTVVSATKITADSPAQPGFVVDVTVTTPSGTSAPVAADHFTYSPGTPTVDEVYASVGPTTGGTPVSIYGADFYGLTGVEFGTTTAMITSLSPSGLSVIAPAHAAGTVDVTVLTSHGNSAASATFTYITPPTITKVAPSSGPDSGGTAVTLTGTGLGTVDTVDFGSSAVSSYEFTSQSATSITLPSPPQAPGPVEVTASVDGVSSTASTAVEFTYTAVKPVVTGISPSSGPTSAGQYVVVEGTGLFALTSVKFGSNAATVTEYSGDGTAVYVTAPAGAVGTVNVTATDSVGTSATSSADDYTYVAAPTVTKVAPVSGPTTGGTSVVITGTDLANATVVDFGTTEVYSFDFTADTATSITLPSPSEGPGEVDVTVVTAGGTSATSTADEFTYDLVAPTVTEIYPSSGAAGTDVEVVGTNMFDVSAVDFGTVAGTVTYVDPGGSYLEVTAPAGTGAVNVRVKNTAGTSPVVAADKFTYS